ncbi:MAG: hypothetical protein VB038_04170 [Methanobrevibacter sp.]|nr:hypothetical protein [Methanobrevibacter sp.]MEA4956901.1 hypothetical protein [Methanobrevibacter sp.]
MSHWYFNRVIVVVMVFAFVYGCCVVYIIYTIIHTTIGTVDDF